MEFPSKESRCVLHSNRTSSSTANSVYSSPVDNCRLHWIHKIYNLTLLGAYCHRKAFWFYQLYREIRVPKSVTNKSAIWQPVPPERFCPFLWASQTIRKEYNNGKAKCSWNLQRDLWKYEHFQYPTEATKNSNVSIQFSCTCLAESVHRVSPKEIVTKTVFAPSTPTVTKFAIRQNALAVTINHYISIHKGILMCHCACREVKIFLGHFVVLVGHRNTA